jgi:diadenosine tetraphosphate (Ap4A) HIT family hydrolase
VLSNTHACAVADAYPVSPGHTLVIPRRHITSVFELTGEEVVAIHGLLCCMKDQLTRTIHPAGYNVGINDGAAAGQTVLHLHVHLIPRFAGDVTDPRGGVRAIIPGKGPYG